MNRRKIQRTVYSIALFLLAAMIMTAILSSCAKKNEPIEYVLYTVGPGDTIWDIAMIYSSDNKDVRKLVYEISNINSISETYIFAGDKLLIPVYR